jgi:stearoyl-CoA desaturase (delta-9 desaturase)
LSPNGGKEMPDRVGAALPRTMEGAAPVLVMNRLALEQSPRMNLTSSVALPQRPAIVGHPHHTGPISVELAPAEGSSYAFEDSPPREIHSRTALSPVERRLRLVNMGAVVVPFAGLALAMILAWGAAFNWTQFAIFISMSYATAIGITVGYHRLFTHKSFTTGPVTRYALAALGSMAIEGAVFEWAATHRKHHQHSDDHDDPHSPHMHSEGSWGHGLWATLRGGFHAHVGWLLGERRRGMGRYVKDLRSDPVLCAVNRQFYLWAIAGLVIPAILGGVLTLSWKGALLGFLWGGLVRILFVHHITWSVNSVCHLWGTRPFRSGDHSRNNPIVALFALGEGWHNNHHAFPASARHGLRWWEFDISYIVIKGLALFGLARGIRVPPRERIHGKHVTRAHRDSQGIQGRRSRLI